MLITREEAIETLWMLANSDILSEDVSDSLEEISRCIEAELEGRHEWGGDEEELINLYVAVREDLITDDFIEKCEKIDRKYRFVPAEYEEDEINADNNSYDEEDYERSIQLSLLNNRV